MFQTTNQIFWCKQNLMLICLFENNSSSWCFLESGISGKFRVSSQNDIFLPFSRPEQNCMFTVRSVRRMSHAKSTTFIGKLSCPSPFCVIQAFSIVTLSFSWHLSSNFLWHMLWRWFWHMSCHFAWHLLWQTCVKQRKQNSHTFCQSVWHFLRHTLRHLMTFLSGRRIFETYSDLWHRFQINHI